MRFEWCIDSDSVKEGNYSNEWGAGLCEGGAFHILVTVMWEWEPLRSQEHKCLEILIEGLFCADLFLS